MDHLHTEPSLSVCCPLCQPAATPANLLPRQATPDDAGSSNLADPGRASPSNQMQIQEVTEVRHLLRSAMHSRVEGHCTVARELTAVQHS